MSLPGSSHRLSHIALHALSAIHAHACVCVLACGTYIAIFQLSRSVVSIESVETWALERNRMVGSPSEADLYIFSTSFDPEFDHQHVRTTGNACNLPNSQPNDRIEIHTSESPPSRSARILDPSQHPIPAHPSDHNLPQAPNCSQILKLSSPTGAIHPRSLKHASRRCF